MSSFSFWMTLILYFCQCTRAYASEDRSPFTAHSPWCQRGDKEVVVVMDKVKKLRAVYVRVADRMEMKEKC